MRKHNGMRPQDIAILLKITANQNKIYKISTLAYELGISLSEVSESLHRSKIAKLISSNKKEVNLLNLMEFLKHGISYVFPQQPGPLVRGIRTAHSHIIFTDKITSENLYVWPYRDGSDFGSEIEPLYKNQAKASLNDNKFYEMLAIVDILRVGKIREKKIAIDLLENYL